jgi:hypothetical protein
MTGMMRHGAKTRVAAWLLCRDADLVLPGEKGRHATRRVVKRRMSGETSSVGEDAEEGVHSCHCRAREQLNRPRTTWCG